MSLATLRFTVVLCAGLVVFAAFPQVCHAQRMVIVNTDDGNGTSISHVSWPDLEELREPDFVRSDVPIFEEALSLSEAQMTSIGRQIEMYLEMFENLKKELLSFPGAEPIAMPFALGGGAAERANGEPGVVVINPPNPENLPSLDLNEIEGLEGVPGMSVSIGVRIGDGDGDEEEDGEGSGVSVNFQPAAGVELPELVRKELEMRAQEMAEQIRAHIEEQRANGGGGEARAAMPMVDAGRIEEMQQHREEMEVAAKAFRRAKSDLRHQFVAEAQAQLSAAQVDRWPALERALLREKSLPKGRLSGERTDLFKVLKKVDASAIDHEELAGTLSAYELELDNALRHRNSTLEDVRPRIDTAMQKQEVDRALDFIDRAIAVRVAIRSLNERYAAAICEFLPGEQAAAFTQSILKAAYPQVYRQTNGERVFSQALKIEGLEQDVTTRIKELELAYRFEREDVDGKLKRAIDKHQPLEPRRPIEHMKAMLESGEGGEMRFGDGSDPIREATAKRRELDERYIKLVTSMLTPEQAEKLPKPSRRAPEPIIIRKSLNDS